MDYEALWTELTTDPADLNYADPNLKESDPTNRDLINDPSRVQTRDSITKQELFGILDVSELNALKDASLRLYEYLRSLDSIDVTSGSNSRAQIDTIFPPDGATGTAIEALISAGDSVSRAQELGLGRVYLDDLDKARKRFGGGS